MNILNDPLPASMYIGNTVKPLQDPAIIAAPPQPALNKYCDRRNNTGRQKDDQPCPTDIITYLSGETYWIAEEAYLRIGNLTTALQKINAHQDRAGTSPLATLNHDILLEENARKLASERSLLVWPGKDGCFRRKN